jgi:hypothetical protein
MGASSMCRRLTWPGGLWGPRAGQPLVARAVIYHVPRPLANVPDRNRFQHAPLAYPRGVTTCVALPSFFLSLCTCVPLYH